MTVPSKFRYRTIAGPILLVAAAIIASLSANAEVIRFEDMRNGTEVSQPQCAVHRHTLWVTAYGKNYCIRYYGSNGGGRGRLPVVYLPGDRPGIVEKTKRYNDKKYQRDADTRAFIKTANRLSKASRTSAIYLARIGVNGSSGHHSLRRTMIELAAYNAALDALKERYRYDGFHLVGNSGGSGLIAAILPLRKDVRCAVLGSGPLWGRRTRPRGREPALQTFRPEDGIPQIARNRSLRVLVVTDPEDTIVPRKYQDPFVPALIKAGGHARQFYVRLNNPPHHGVQVYSFFVAGACAQDRSDGQIEGGLKRIEARLLAKRPKRERQRGNDD
jgi:pimeloyl-ACP methyl ester carboxylesterase